MEERMIKVRSKYDSAIALKVIPGHFITSQSHITHYLELTTMKTRIAEAVNVAKVLAQKYELSTPVDTIICFDGLEVVGAFLAQELTKAGIHSMNAHQTIYVITPEYGPNGQIVFRDNIQPMLKGKNVVILIGSITTGQTLHRSLDTIPYYGGIIQGVSAVFSAVTKVAGVDVNSIFSKKDVPEYNSYKAGECPLCRQKQKIDAIVNSFGYSKLS